jgi:excisionase family DNA binding protein
MQGVGDELLTEEELARYLKVTVRTVRNWRAEGTGPRPLRAGRGVRYRRRDVDEWLEREAERRDRDR